MVEGHGRFSARWLALRVRPDEDDVMRRRRAVESVDSEANHPAWEALSVNPPGRVRVRHHEFGRLEATVGHPERDGTDGNGDIDDDGPIDPESEVPAREGRSFAREQLLQQGVAACRERGQLALGATTAQTLADGTNRDVSGRGLLETRISARKKESSHDQDEPDSTSDPRDFHDTRSGKVKWPSAAAEGHEDHTTGQTGIISSIRPENDPWRGCSRDLRRQ